MSNKLLVRYTYSTAAGKHISTNTLKQTYYIQQKQTQAQCTTTWVGSKDVRQHLHYDDSEKNVFENIYSVHGIAAFTLIRF